ncbi:catalase/peroxidase HPI [Idiomarina seosinensis]|uniref:catalase/peroxidase HPI n=1 Tax=Idiomarina seosinensis TaxID=281739 RepID=UPI0038513A88
MKKSVLPIISAVAVAVSMAVSSTSVTAQERPSYHANQTMTEAKENSFWWPNMLNLEPLRQHSPESNPLGEDFDYASAFNQLDLQQVKKDIEELMTSDQDWWPADYGHYGPFFIRMAWHGAGTYRVQDGRGGGAGAQQRFEPLNSWPDNVSLDKARRLLWPVKQKYGQALSWGDLMALTGNVALESMGFETYGFAGGREDAWEPDIVYWGPEAQWLGDERYKGERELENPLAAVQMGLIYVNPEGPNGTPDPVLAAKDIRDTFARMAMNDEETVALIAGGHTFGKAHGAHDPEECLEAEPAAAPVEQQGLGWKNNCGKGNAEDTVTSGLEGAWSAAPTRWTMQYLDNLFNYEWEQTRSPAGGIQWIPKDGQASNLVPDAHVEGKRHAPIMFTTDLSLKEDPEYRKIAKRFQENPEEFELAFAKAWFKLTHRDMGPKARYLGDMAPQEDLVWQDPIPEVDFELVNDSDVAELKQRILASDLTVPELVRTAWAAASSFRATDLRGGVNGARIALEPQINWEANNPEELQRVLGELKQIRADFNDDLSGNKKISLADTIVLAGAAAIEKAAEDAGHQVTVPFVAGRNDATQEMTDVHSFSFLEPTADAFRNYYSTDSRLNPAQMTVDKADRLDLTVPEMTVLVGGLRTLDANYQGAKHGVFTDQPGTLSNDFFVNLMSMDTQWAKSEDDESVFIGRDRESGEQKYTATTVDLIFGSNSELRAVSEIYALNDSKEKFVNDFVAAWTKVMQLDRFDLKS